MPNTFAYFALFASPVLFYVLFRVLSLQVAICASILAGYLLLPERPSIDLPYLPSLDKTLIPSVSVLVLAALRYSALKSRAAAAARFGQEVVAVPPVMPGLRPRSVVITLALAMIVLGSLGTALTNGDAVRAGGPLVLPGLRIFDAFSLTLNAAVILLPMLLGRKYLADPEGHRLLLVVLTIAGLLYCIPSLIEIRLSPQMSVWIYGFFPHSFLQHMRDGGFRPVVFLNHGLWLSIVLASSFLGALAVLRLKDTGEKLVWFVIAFVLLVTLVLSKSLGALLITVVLAPVILFLNKQGMLLFVVGTCAVILLYPMVRSLGLIPIEAILDLVTRIDASRAGSLAYRVFNEDAVLASAMERSIFGWGGWGRGQIYNSITGQRVSVSDGEWIVQLLIGGWVRYLALFGIMTLPVMILWLTRKGADVPMPTVLLSVVLLANLIDLIPNATLTPVTWLLAGALVGSLEFRPVTATDPSPVQPQVTGEAVDAPRGRYARATGRPKIRRAKKVRPAGIKSHARKTR